MPRPGRYQRAFPVPAFEIRLEDGLLTVHTQGFELRYRTDRPFERNSLSNGCWPAAIPAAGAANGITAIRERPARHDPDAGRADGAIRWSTGWFPRRGTRCWTTEKACSSRRTAG
jgi:hypothetical protein